MYKDVARLMDLKIESILLPLLNILISADQLCSKMIELETNYRIVVLIVHVLTLYSSIYPYNYLSL